MNEQLERFVAQQLSERPTALYWEPVARIPKINDFEKVIWHFSNLWLQTKRPNPLPGLSPQQDAAERAEAREAIHQAQSSIVGLWCGAAITMLSEADLDAWSETVNWNLRNLRRFNDSLLGFYWSIKQLGDDDATFYNILAWYYTLNDLLLSDAVRRLEAAPADWKLRMPPGEALLYRASPQSALNKRIEEVRQSVSRSNALARSFCERLSVTPAEIDFMRAALSIVDGSPDEVPWEDFVVRSNLRTSLVAPRHFHVRRT